MNGFDAAAAARFATITLGHLGQEYPNKLDHVMTGAHDAQTPAALFPIFHGSFDWHSCVHGWWQVLTIARLFPDLPESERVRTRGNAMLVPDKVAGELAYLARPSSAGFERPYGWAWALALHGEAVRHPGHGWGAALAPLAHAFANRFRAFLPKQTYPIRVGTHYSSAFALTLAHDWATAHDAALARLIEERALGWFAADRGCQAWEPGGDEFLSPALGEALLMSRVMPPAAFADWFALFLPDLDDGRPATLFTPATVSDRGDGKIVHLDGLNLSRAWCWRGIARRLGSDHPQGAMFRDAADRHLAAAMPHLDDDYMGAHWLASFALLALLA